MADNEGKKWVCTVCGYVYDGDVPFEKLPEDWLCPLCGVGKDMFELQQFFIESKTLPQKQHSKGEFFL